MASKKSTNIQYLLQAEQEASEIVKEARKQRLIKLKQAKDEADNEIKKFKESKEILFQKFQTEHLQGGNDNFELTLKKEQIIKLLKEGIQKKKENVVKFIIDDVINVNIELEAEQKAFIGKRG
ncbi:hypothetical protein ABK040_013084 [Willaertia magna]